MPLQIPPPRPTTSLDEDEKKDPQSGEREWHFFLQGYCDKQINFFFQETLPLKSEHVSKW
jgi:hypothetical protein